MENNWINLLYHEVRILPAVHVSLDKVLFRLGLLNDKNILGGWGGRSGVSKIMQAKPKALSTVAG